jgi:hypothetical protein
MPSLRALFAGQWLHVDIAIEWPYRRATLTLGGVRIASEVGFASGSDTVAATEVHLFSFDHATVWWDDIAIRY